MKDLQDLNYIFHVILQAFFEIILLVASIASCVYTFKPINETASYLMIPYLMWVSFATLLTYSIWKMNPEESKSTKKKGK